MYIYIYIYVYMCTMCIHITMYEAWDLGEQRGQRGRQALHADLGEDLAGAIYIYIYIYVYVYTYV